MASAAREYRYCASGIQHKRESGPGSGLGGPGTGIGTCRRGPSPRADTGGSEGFIIRNRFLVRERQAIPMLSVLGVTAVAVAAVMLLLSYVQLTTLAADTVALKSELTVLQAENVSLTAQHEQMFDMATVKEVAAAAGMAKPTSSQITYLDLDSEDSAVVYRTETPSVFSRILSSLHHGVYAVVEYFD